MADLELKDLVSFDELVTPRIAKAVFWIAEATNFYVWIEILRKTYKSSSTSISFGGSSSFDSSTHINWETIIFVLLMLALTTVLIRVAADLVLCIFRWQASTRGILMALTGAPPALAAAQSPAQGMPGSSYRPPAAPRPTTVMTPPPWEAAIPPQPQPPQPPAQPPQPPAQPPQS